MDHVVPRCKGGATSWTNVVACCNPCNNRKGFSTLRQIEASYGMRLLTGPPRVPSSYDLQARARRFPPTLMHETWENYLCLTDDAKKRTRSLVARQREAPDEGGGGVLLKKNEEMKTERRRRRRTRGLRSRTRRGRGTTARVTAGTACSPSSAEAPEAASELARKGQPPSWGWLT